MRDSLRKAFLERRQVRLLQASLLLAHHGPHLSIAIPLHGNTHPQVLNLLTGQMHVLYPQQPPTSPSNGQDPAPAP